MVLSADKLNRLLCAIVSRAVEKEGFVTKTKLLKYLYLADLEAWRHFGKSFTGFKWVFFHFGPWSRQFDALYEDLKQCGQLITRPTTGVHEGELLRAAEPAEIEEAIDHLALTSRVRQIVDFWADRPLAEMLDYIYFHTAPMQNARRGLALDLSKVATEELDNSIYTKTSPDAKEVRAMRSRIERALST